MQHHHLQQAVQLMAQIANAFGDIFHLSNQSLLLGKRDLRGPSLGSFPFGLAFCLPLDGWQTILFLFYRTIEASLDLGRHMQGCQTSR